MLCNKTNISNIIIDMDLSTQIDFLNKPILMISIGAAVVLGLIYFYFFSALKQRLHFLFLALTGAQGVKMSQSVCEIFMLLKCYKTKAPLYSSP